MTDLDNVGRARAWRELVALRMRVAGFRDARPRIPKRGKLSHRIGSGADPEPDVLGLPEGVYVETRTDFRERFGMALDAAEQTGGIVGARHVAVIQYRRRAVGDGYVVMSIEGWAGLVRDAYNVEVSA